MRQRGFSAIIVAVLTALLFVIVLTVFNLNKNSSISLPGRQDSPQSQNENYVALGASFSKANNLSSKLIGDNPEYSFATGTKIESIYLFLKNTAKEIVKIRKIFSILNFISPPFG